MAHAAVRGGLPLKLNDAEAEATETQTWLEFAVKSGYMNADIGRELYHAYDLILGKLVAMIHNPKPWLIRANQHWGQ